MSVNPWFRMYAEAVDDDKLRLLAFEDRWHFVAILCCKAQGVLDTHPETLDRRVAVKLGLQLRDADELKRRLMDVDLVDESWQPKAWDKRQFISDSSADRTRKWREKKRNDGEGGSSAGRETSPKRHRDDVVTKSKRHRDALDTDTDTDTEERGEVVRETAAPVPASAAPPASPSAPPAPDDPRPPKSRSQDRGARLPNDWTLPDAWRRWAEGERPDLDIGKVAACFADHWHSAPGAKGRKANWEATWRNWVRNESKPAMKKPGQGNGHETHQRHYESRAERSARLFEYDMRCLEESIASGGLDECPFHKTGGDIRH